MPSGRPFAMRPKSQTIREQLNMVELYTIVPYGGLCNRLRVILSWQQKAKAEGRKLYVYWTLSEACNGNFSKYFKPLNNVQIFEWQPSLTREIDYNGYAACGLFNARGLQLQPQLQEEVEAFKGQLGEYDAIHVRRTDLTPVAMRDGNYIDDSAFFAFIEASERPVYLATDNLATQRIYKAKFGQKIRFMYEIPSSRANMAHFMRQTPLEYAIMDIYICAGAHNFMGTAGSSFSEFIEIMRLP